MQGALCATLTRRGQVAGVRQRVGEEENWSGG